MHPKSGSLDDDLRRRFTATAERLLGAGIVGFGEMTALHFSFRRGHPFEQTAPDHPLFLLLADIAARADVPIDLHMEAVAHDIDTPQALRQRSAANPARVVANIAAFERLLDHNRAARIVWTHLGWDNSGHRTAALTRNLLARHANLYLAIKIVGRPGRPNALVTPGDELDPQWRAVIEAFPDRFMIGGDQFFLPPGSRLRFPKSLAATVRILELLPAALARKVAHENARRVYRLAPATDGE